MLKMSDNPPIFTQGVSSLEDMKGQWMVAHTRSRFEKALAWDLHQQSIGYFLPMVERVKFSGGRKRRTMNPLFPSYVFICGDESDRYASMRTNRVCQIIPVVDQQAFIRQISAIERALAGKAELDFYPDLPVGSRCRIKAGPLMGLEGVVVRRNSKARFVLRVDFIGQGAAMEVDADLLELL